MTGTLPTTITRIYLASRFDRKKNMAALGGWLEAKGFTITSRWHSGAHDQPTDHELTTEELQRFAAEDLEDIRSADALVLMLEEPSAGYMSGGRLHETGYADALGKHIILLGYKPENVFHHGLPLVDTWSALAAYLQPFLPKPEPEWWAGSWTCPRCNEHVVMGGNESGVLSNESQQVVVAECPACGTLQRFTRNRPKPPRPPVTDADVERAADTIRKLSRAAGDDMSRSAIRHVLEQFDLHRPR